MTRRRLFIFAAAFLLIAPVFTYEIYLEADQMLCLKIGLEEEIIPRWGIKGSIGLSPLGITVISYDLAGFYRISDDDSRRFRLSTEFGLNLAYFDIFEGNVTDRSPYIDDPYAGFAPGINLNWGYTFKRGILGLKTGAFYWNEYQRDSGWGGFRWLPEITLEYKFLSRERHRRKNSPE